MTNRVVAPDVWSAWLLHHRHGDDPAYARLVQTAVEGYADRVLDGAQLAAGMHLVDVVAQAGGGEHVWSRSGQGLAMNAVAG